MPAVEDNRSRRIGLVLSSLCLTFCVLGVAVWIVKVAVGGDGAWWSVLRGVMFAVAVLAYLGQTLVVRRMSRPE
jgi:hypothetical protein